MAISAKWLASSMWHRENQPNPPSAIHEISYQYHQ